MTNIGFIGDVKVGKTDLLRMVVRYINNGEIETIKGGAKCVFVKTDFSGENPQIIGDTQTVHPSRVFFKEEESKKAHSLYAPGGNRESIVVKMGILNITRIATQLIAVFSCDRELKHEFEFFNDLPYFPDNLYVCLTRSELFEGALSEKEIKIDEIKRQIRTYFQEKKCKVKGFFTVYLDFSNLDSDKKLHNDYFVAMLLRIPDPIVSFEDYSLTKEELEKREFEKTKLQNQQIMEEANQAFNNGHWDLCIKLYEQSKEICAKQGWTNDVKYAEAQIAKAKVNEVAVIRNTVLDIVTKFSRVHVVEISELCLVQDLQLITDIVKKMIKDNELSAQFFASTRFVAFNQKPSKRRRNPYTLEQIQRFIIRKSRKKM